MDQIFTARRLSGGAIGIGNGDQTGFGRDGIEQGLEGEAEVLFRRKLDDLRRCSRCIDLIHGVGRHGQQDFSSGFEVGLAEQDEWLRRRRWESNTCCGLKSS